MFARTTRLTLRPGWPEDAAALAKAIAHEDVVTKLSRVPWPYDEAMATDWLMRDRTSDDVFCLILAHEESTPTLIGGIGLHREADVHEIGYWLTPGAWGRGYATEAGHAVLGMARYALGLKRLTAGYFVGNPASGRVLRKLGFRETGLKKQYSLARGRDVDCVTMAIEFDAEESRMPIAA